MATLNSNTFYYNTNPIFFNYKGKTVKFINNKIKYKKNATSASTDNNDEILDIFDNLQEESYEEDYINIYSFDTLLDFKKKISNIFSIDWFNTTIYWEHNNVFISTYDIYVNNTIYNPNYENIDISDEFIYDNKNETYVIMNEETTLLNYFISNDIKNINVINLKDYKKIITTKKSLEYYYYNFIIKYFPFHTLDTFILYHSDIKTFKEKYTTLYNYSYINHYVELDRLLLLNNEININTTNFNYTIKKINYNYAYHILITNNNVNIRNIFDHLHINEYDIIKLIFIFNNTIYIKYNKNDNPVKLYRSEITQNMLTICINNDYNIPSRPIFLKINILGTIEISIQISDQYNLSFEEVSEYVFNKCNKILDVIDNNKYKFNIYSDVEKLTKKHLAPKYGSNIKCIINQQLIINRNIKSNFFNEMLVRLNNLPIMFNKISHNKFNSVLFYIHTNISSFNVHHFRYFSTNKPNYYSIYTNINDMKLWKEKYMGIPITITHNPGLIDIDIKGISINDIIHILFIVNTIISIQQNSKNEDDKLSFDNKKIRKLKKIDPIMFNFSESKYSKKKYSKICQQPFHPNIYTNNEIQNISDKEKKKLIKYINATTNEMVYYGCSNKRSPYLGFIVNEHPMGYCIPCCRVKTTVNKKYYKDCITKYKYQEDIQLTDKYKNTYILKNIYDERLSELTPNLNLIFNKKFKEKFYNYGIQGILNIINFCINNDEDEIITVSDISELHKLKINILIFSENGNMDINMYYNYKTYILVYNTENTYYPIVNSMNKKIYTENDSIIKYLLSILYKHQSINNNNNPLHFEYINKKYEIKHIHVNNKNYIFGAMIFYKGDELYIPVTYYYNTTTYSVKNMITDELPPSDIILKFLLNENLDKYITNIVYSKYEDLYIGFNITNLSNELFYPFEQVNKLPNKVNEYVKDTVIDIKYIFYPINKISKKIYNNDYNKDLKIYDYKYFDIYYKNLYKLILQHITLYFNNNKEESIREYIYNIIADTNNTYNKIMLLLQEKIPSDVDAIFEIINSTFNIKDNYIKINENSLKSLKTKLNNKDFNIDYYIRYKFLEQSDYTTITNLFENIFEFKLLKDINITKPINNIIMPCELDPNNQYCTAKKKLIIPIEYKNKFISLFYNDSKNSFKNVNLLNEIIYINEYDLFNLIPGLESLVIHSYY